MSERIIKIDSKQAVSRIMELLPQWENYVIRTGRILEVVVRPHEEARTHDQNKRMWAMLSALERHGVVCKEFDRALSAVAWHKWLRIKHGYIAGTELSPLPNGAGGWLLVETPAPQPTHDGSKYQMTKAQHSEYMERIHDELHDAGIAWDVDEQVA